MASPLDAATWVLEDEYRLLVLALSLPSERRGRDRGTRISITDTRVRVDVDRSWERAATLLPSEETIVLAGALLAAAKSAEDIEETGLRGELLRRAASLGAARPAMASEAARGLMSQYSAASDALLHVVRDFDPRAVAVGPDSAMSAMRQLEERQLVVDPAFTSSIAGLVVLAGLTPLQFSVRTERGDRIIRHLSARAPLWELDWRTERRARGRRGSHEFRVRIRGVAFVHRLLKEMASTYLQGEERALIEAERPTMSLPSDLRYPDDSRGSLD